ncbi:type II secretion system F family protein [Leptolyngbya sp. 15MV]|nr:type II secretion system F family protein [Leptolyngbya sp. 15MV]
MPNYRYQVRSASNQMQVGVMSADSLATAAALLRNQGMHVVSIAPVVGGIDGGELMQRLRELNHGRPKTKHVLDFTQQLAVMMKAGINLRSALEGIADQTTHPGFKKVIIQLRTDVESGKQFSDAIARHPKLFGPLYVNMVRASEMSGSFANMLDRIAGYIAQQMETRKMVVGASIYPGVIGTMAVSVTVFLLTFVLPKFYKVFEGKEEVLPWATKFLMNCSKFMTANWMFLVGGLAFAGIGGFAFAKTELGGFFIDRMKLAIPVLKTMFRSLYISRSLRSRA